MEANGGCENMFCYIHMYLEKVKKQRRTESFLGGNKVVRTRE
jgi:hypothetical protein